MRIALHDHRPIGEMRQQHGGDVRVVLQEIALRQPKLLPEDLAEVRQANVLAVHRQDHIVLIARDRQRLPSHLRDLTTLQPRALAHEHRCAYRGSAGSFGGRDPCRAAPATGTYSSSNPSTAFRSSRPPRLMSPRPTNSMGNRSWPPNMVSRTSTYFGEAMLPSRTTSQSGPISSGEHAGASLERPAVGGVVGMNVGVCKRAHGSARHQRIGAAEPGVRRDDVHTARDRAGRIGWDGKSTSVCELAAKVEPAHECEQLAEWRAFARPQPVRKREICSRRQHLPRAGPAAVGG